MFKNKSLKEREIKANVRLITKEAKDIFKYCKEEMDGFCYSTKQQEALLALIRQKDKLLKGQDNGGVGTVYLKTGINKGTTLFCQTVLDLYLIDTPNRISLISRGDDKRALMCLLGSFEGDLDDCVVKIIKNIKIFRENFNMLYQEVAFSDIIESKTKELTERIIKLEAVISKVAGDLENIWCLEYTEEQTPVLGELIKILRDTLNLDDNVEE